MAELKSQGICAYGGIAGEGMPATDQYSTSPNTHAFPPKISAKRRRAPSPFSSAIWRRTDGPSHGLGTIFTLTQIVRQG